jgi:hypothetical protein
MLKYEIIIHFPPLSSTFFFDIVNNFFYRSSSEKHLMQVIAHKKFIKKFCTPVSSQKNCPISKPFSPEIRELAPFYSTFAGMNSLPSLFSLSF